MKNTGTGVGFIGLLQIALIVLKLLGAISWKWFWVLSPMWITAILMAVLLVIGVIIKLS